MDFNGDKRIDTLYVRYESNQNKIDSMYFSWGRCFCDSAKGIDTVILPYRVTRLKTTLSSTYLHYTPTFLPVDTNGTVHLLIAKSAYDTLTHTDTGSVSLLFDLRTNHGFDTLTYFNLSIIDSGYTSPFVHVFPNQEIEEDGFTSDFGGVYFSTINFSNYSPKIANQEDNERGNLSIPSIQISPNPANEKVIINSQFYCTQSTRLFLYQSQTGKSIGSYPINSNGKVEINTDNLTDGLYYIVLNCQGEIVLSSHFIVIH